MIRAILDPNVLISALLSRNGTPAQLVKAWTQGEFDLVVSDRLLIELKSALDYPKIQAIVQPEAAQEFVEFLSRSAVLAADPTNLPQVVSQDSDDNYLIALAETETCLLVSGDKHLLRLSDHIPVFAPGEFLGHLG